MGFWKDRRVVAALALFVVAAFVASIAGRLTFRLLLLVVLAGAAVAAVAWVLRRAPALAAGRGRLREVALLPPPERYRHRSPTTQEALVRALENARLGEVRADSAEVLVDGGRAGRARLTLAKTQDVVLADLSVQATSTEFALAVCDALAPVVGPFTFRAEGLELFVDGTTPMSELLRQLHDLRMTGPRKPAPTRSGGGYLH